MDYQFDSYQYHIQNKLLDDLEKVAFGSYEIEFSQIEPYIKDEILTIQT